MSALDSPPAASSERLQVLIVEDESLIAMDLQGRLMRLGYDVSAIVDNGPEAIEHLRAAKCDFILMDIHIQGQMDGVETAAEIRKFAETPLIFLTAHADDATLQRAGLTEPFGYVLKPFDERELQATIQMAMYRFRAESRLRNMERWLATTLRSIGDGVIATDSEGRITFINAMAEALSGWTRGAAIGRHLTEVFVVVTKEGPEETFELLHKAMTEGVTIALGDGRFLRTKDGRLTPIDDSLAPIRDDQGAITGCVVIFRDHTAQVEAEKQRKRLEAKMQEAQRLESLGVLASGIAHDFNNLLVAVTCNASLGRTMLPTESPVLPCLHDIEEAAERAATLCRQMLTYSGKSQSQLQPLDLNTFTRETTQLLQTAVHQDTELSFDLPERLPPVNADRSQLQQIIMNLVINGSESLRGNPGRVVVRTGLCHADRATLSTFQIGAELPEADYLFLEVSDTGHGMSKDVLTRIFDPFFTTKFSGRGLGLAAISGIVRVHGGALSVESMPGAGTTFRVLFPPLPGDHLEPKAASPDLSWRGSGRVLLADDELAIRLAGSATLRYLGFEVDTAEDGQQAIAQATDPRIDYAVILLDLTMPKIDGHKAFQAIRSERPAVPVLLMSGYPEHKVQQALQNGPTAFVQKPFSLESLAGKLMPLLRGH